jgi:hypothetical protein
MLYTSVFILKQAPLAYVKGLFHALQCLAMFLEFQLVRRKSFYNI